MVAAQKKIAETMEFVDLVIEVLDARAPKASQNPLTLSLSQARDRPQLKVLNKSDLADPDVTQEWLTYFNGKAKTKAIAISCKKLNEPKKILALAKALAPHRGTPLKPLRMMIMGIPNVGKSTLINALAGKKIAKAANEPAVTKQQQRITLTESMLLIDTPGLMWPKIESEEDALRLAINLNIGKNAYDEEEIAKALGHFLIKRYPALIQSRFKLEMLPQDGVALIEMIATQRSLYKKNQVIDFLRGSQTLLTDYRDGLIGPISLQNKHDLKEDLFLKL